MKLLHLLVGAVPGYCWLGNKDLESNTMITEAKL
jgi:hypothetical protein